MLLPTGQPDGLVFLPKGLLDGVCAFTQEVTGSRDAYVSQRVNDLLDKKYTQSFLKNLSPVS